MSFKNKIKLVSHVDKFNKFNTTQIDAFWILIVHGWVVNWSKVASLILNQIHCFFLIQIVTVITLSCTCNKYLFYGTIFWCFKILPKYHLYSYAWIHFYDVFVLYYKIVVSKIHQETSRIALHGFFKKNYTKNWVGQ